MKLQRFKAKNLFSIGYVDIDLDKKGLVLVTGYSKDEDTANGSGKSTVSSKGIVWTLFGQTVSGQKADDAINIHGDGTPTCGQVVFEGVDGISYTVSRCRNPDSLSLFKMIIPGSPVSHNLTKRDSRETQKLINEVLGRDFKTFLQTDFFGQGREKSFLALTPKQQAEVLEEILPIDQIDCWNSCAKKARGLVEEPIAHANLILNRLYGQRSEASYIELAAISDFNKYDNDTKDTIHRLKTELASFSDKKGEIESLKAVMRVQEHKLLDHARVYEDTQNWEVMLTTWSNDKEVADSKSTGIKHKIESINLKVRSIEDRICPTCEQEIDNALTNSLIQEQHEIQGQLKDLNNDYTTWTSVSIRAQGHITNTQYSLNKQLRLEQQDTELRADLLKNKELLLSMKSECKTEELESKIAQLSKVENPHSKLVRRATLRLASLDTTMKDQKNALKLLKEEAESIDFWLDTFSKKFKNYLFRRACPYLEYRTAEHLKGLDNMQLKVTFSTAKLLKSGDARSEFNVKVRSVSGAPSFSLLSGGEQKIVSFAVGLALADLAETQSRGPSKFMILDEPFEYIQGKNCEALISYLTSVLTKHRETILLVSNDESLKPLVAKQLSVVKEKGCTRVTEAI